MWQSKPLPGDMQYLLCGTGCSIQGAGSCMVGTSVIALSDDAAMRLNSSGAGCHQPLFTSIPSALVACCQGGVAGPKCIGVFMCAHCYLFGLVRTCDDDKPYKYGVCGNEVVHRSFRTKAATDLSRPAAVHDGNTCEVCKPQCRATPLARAHITDSSTRHQACGSCSTSGASGDQSAAYGGQPQS